MKEEAPSKKMPPKMMNGGNFANIHTKAASDEILSTLLRINNFDSISSIKDESLDIDLSACVTISADPAVMINGNSLSSVDFWRVLDESAQNSHLDITAMSDEGSAMHESQKSKDSNTTNYSTTMKTPLKAGTNTFSENFLRPELPSVTSYSPSKRITNIQSEDESNKRRGAIGTMFYKYKDSPDIKEEPAEHLFNQSSKNNLISAPIFEVIRLPSVTAKAETLSNTIKNLSKCAVGDGTPIAISTQAIYKCLDCDGKLLNGQKELKSHEAASHRIHYKCSLCEREFEQDAGLKKHLKTHRSVESRKDAWKKCPDCGKCLKLGSMWMHRKIHSDNKKYGCEICGQKFVQKINLTHHSRIHTAEKPFECPECQKRFQERSHLQRHQKYHAQTRSYRCEKCGKMYKTERCLKVHNLVHLEQRPFACNVCDKSFISNSKLKQHSNIHTGERPFKCNYCPRDFTNFPNWLKHTRRRHKVDHKTGEHLENIPSYCSKKSTKSTKSSQKVSAEADANNTGANKATNMIANDATLTKSGQPRRKKKVTELQSTCMDQGVVNTLSTLEPNLSTFAPPPVVNTPKITKAKRERKQLTPKQVQKPPMVAIKRELMEPKMLTKDTKPQTTSNFPDLHCLSLASAEELIMEQALEMEESGLYIPPASANGTDNAISSDAIDVLQFKIKNEYGTDRIKQEFVNQRGEVQSSRLLCSSLESSPYSSPASIEITSSTASSVPSNTTLADTPITSTATNLYAHNLTINSSEGAALVTSLNNITSILSATPTQQQQQGANDIEAHAMHSISLEHELSGGTHEFINRLYLPLTMPLLVPPNQVLPSVSTLLFPSNASLYGKNIIQTTAAQQNMS